MFPLTVERFGKEFLAQQTHKCFKTQSSGSDSQYTINQRLNFTDDSPCSVPSFRETAFEM